MLKMSFLGEMNTVLIFIALIYWCVSKNFGNYLLMGWNGGRVVNGFLKVTACVYRPWIRDARIVPSAEALPTATGYSFPSGHSTNAGALYGGGAIRRELSKALRITLGIIAVLIALSRNYLGVHTPQDILVGLGSGLLVMWLTAKLIAWIEKNPTDVTMVTRITRLATGLLSYYAVSLILASLLKGWIPGVGGSIVSSFIQMFYISFIFPWLIKHFERVREYRSGRADHGMV
ncbi:MAG: phosphatase PAP2 family protein [Lachnospiraceae bacterium]|nr:phosphatase PAP2 family protein [Lachnospiraceae bacterium]